MNPWDKPKRGYNKSSKVTTFSGSWQDIDWADLYKQCVEVQTDAVHTAEEENKVRYSEYIENKRQEREQLNPEAGSFEGDLGEEFPFREIPGSRMLRIRAQASAKTVEDFVISKNIKSFAPQLMNEVIKHISTYKLSTMDGDDYDALRLKGIPLDSSGRPHTDEGQVSSARLYRSMITDDTMKGLYQFLMMDTRSSYLDKQYTAPSKSWCALVPLILSAFKIHKGVPYSHWDKSQIVGLVNGKLYDAMTADIPEFSKDELIMARQEGLLTKTGPSAGKLRNPLHTYRLWGVKAFEGIPEYAQTILAQIWCAHPNNRTKYMILDPVKWDNIPESLITTDVLAPTISYEKYNNLSLGSEPLDLPWNT